MLFRIKKKKFFFTSRIHFSHPCNTVQSTGAAHSFWYYTTLSSKAALSCRHSWMKINQWTHWTEFFLKWLSEASWRRRIIGGEVRRRVRTAVHTSIMVLIDYQIPTETVNPYIFTAVRGAKTVVGTGINTMLLIVSMPLSILLLLPLHWKQNDLNVLVQLE